MPDRCRRHFLKNREAKILLKNASEKLQTDLNSIFRGRADIEVIETDNADIILVNGKPIMIKTSDGVYPTLKFEEYLHLTPKIIVDMGAVPNVCKGADVMAPGVKRIEGTFRSNSIVTIADEKFGKLIALGEILFGSEEAKKLTKGKVVKNLFYVGDKTWNVLKELTFDDH
jgi:PUA domain protein